MLEAVGHAYLGAFFLACDRLLKPDGLLFVQVITMADSRYESYRTVICWGFFFHFVDLTKEQRPDFINIHIFPGGCCPSLTALVTAATENSALQGLTQKRFFFLGCWKITQLSQSSTLLLTMPKRSTCGMQNSRRSGLKSRNRATMRRFTASGITTSSIARLPLTPERLETWESSGPDPQTEH